MSDLDWRPQLLGNVARVLQNVAAACQRAGRPAAEVHLVAVTKYVALDVARALVAGGVIDLGENYAQQLVARARACGAARFDWPASAPSSAPAAPRWHMIGHVQRNKVKALLPHTRIFHSLDSERLAATLQEQAAAADASVDVFIEVNAAGEATKTGAAPEQAARLAAAVAACPRLRLRGLMTMAPYDPDPEASRPYFAGLRELRQRLQAHGDVAADCVHLSMGMSQDYAVAVEEGATFIRVGSALFEGLPSADPRAAG